MKANPTLDRKRGLEVLQNELYGRMPDKPEHLRYEIKTVDCEFAAGEAVLNEVDVICELCGKEYRIPTVEMRPKREGRCPLFIYLTTESCYPDKHLPTEELAERGFAVITLRASDVCTDDNDFKGDLPRALGVSRRRGDGTSKTAIWAWALLRIGEYARSADWVDTNRIALIGHGGIAAAALLAGAFDESCPVVITNEGGIYCDTVGASEARLMYKEMLPHRFCPRGIGRSESFNESLQVHEPCEVRLGRIHHHVRNGARYLSRHDWAVYMDILEKSK